MTYRDDLDAMRTRADRLETELTECREEIAKLQGQRDTLVRALGATPIRWRIPVALIAFGLGATGGVMFDRGRTPPPAPSAQPAAIPAFAGLGMTAPRIPTITRREVVEGRARVRRQEGWSASAGAECSVRAEVSDGSIGSSLLVQSLAISCPGAPVYEWSSRRGTCTAGELPTKVPGIWRYPFSCFSRPSDGPAAFSVRSGSETILKIDEEKFRAEVVLAHDALVRSGTPLIATNATPKAHCQDPVVRTGRVSSVSGATAPAVGASCEITMASCWDAPFACRAKVTCGGEPVYGGRDGVYVECSLEDGVPSGFTDQYKKFDDGDPAVMQWSTLNSRNSLKTATLEITDDEPAKSSIRIELDPHAAGN